MEFAVNQIFLLDQNHSQKERAEMPALFAFANRARQWYNTYNWVKYRLLRGHNTMWKNRIRAGNPACMGVTKTGRDVNFAVAVKDQKSCSLLLYRKGTDEPEQELEFSEAMRFGDICAMRLEEFPVQEYDYNYRIDGEIVQDPYADCILGREVWGKNTEGTVHLRCQMRFESFAWAGDQPLSLPVEQCILYKTHVRGFTMDPGAKVRHPGTFAGVREKIPYLKKLGITQLLLMPVYEFAEVSEKHGVKKHMPVRKGAGDRINYWGYGKASYFAPKASYSASGDPVRELKTLIRELHKNGMELILEFYFPEGIRPGLVLDCIRHWVKEYHIDGVQINSDTVFTTLLSSDPLLAKTKILSEYFDTGHLYEKDERPGFRHLMECNDDFMMKLRRFLKGDEGALQELMEKMCQNPEQVIPVNYAAGHNGFTLMDSVSYESKHNEANGEDNRDGSDYNCGCNYGEEGQTAARKLKKLRERQLRNALLLVLLSQGVPAVYGGDEMENSQQGNNNVYCQDNELSWIQWPKTRSGKNLQNFTKDAIEFRKTHPAFGRKRAYTMHDTGAKGMPDLSYHGRKAWYGDFEGGSRHVGILYAGCHTGGETLYVVCNMHTTSQELALPTLPSGEFWRVIADTGCEGQCFFPEGREPELVGEKTVKVAPRTIMIMAGRKDAAD